MTHHLTRADRADCTGLAGRADRTARSTGVTRTGQSIAAAAAALLLLVGCAAEPGDSSPAPDAGSKTDVSGGSDSNSETDANAEPAPEALTPVSQAEDCEWDTPVLPAGAAPAAPTGTEGDLNTVLIGSWQHTHYDEGAGYVPLEGKDIRFVFPAEDRLLYCQHVPGITDYAENAADIGWDGTTILVQETTRLYTVNSWSADSMVWINERDGSRYLLQRR